MTELSYPPELDRLSQWERVNAIRKYDSWNRYFAQRDGVDHPTNRGRALNLAYVATAQRWLSIAGPITFIAAAFWSFGMLSWTAIVAASLTILDMYPISRMIVRWRESRLFWNQKVRP